MPKLAREVMTSNPECIGENETLLDAARKMADSGFGAMPICGEDNRLKGMLTDRDIVVKALAQGMDRPRPGPASSARASRSPSVPTTRSRRSYRPWPGTRCAVCR
jgi:CBS-domain-containing membrane protein